MSTEVVSASQSRGAAPGPRDEQRDVPERAEHGRRRLAPVAVLAEVVAVVGGDDHDGVVPRPARVERVEHASEPVVDHRHLAP